METTLFSSQNSGCTFNHGSSLYSDAKDWNAIISTTTHEIDTGDITQQIKRLVQVIRHIDLTTLAGDDTKAVVQKLCHKAVKPVPENLGKSLVQYVDSTSAPLRVAAVCVYPARVDDCRTVLRPSYMDINIASTAGGFPAGQTTLSVKKLEIREAILSGASEIDTVINRSFALDGDWEKVYAEVKQMKEVCHDVARMKTILATGELGSLDNIYKASVAAMLAGSDFIKTSTGKESVNATIPVGIVMMTAIKDYYELTGYKVGFKPAGGIKTAKDALTWLTLVKNMLGEQWLTPELFRFGASSLLDNVVKELYVMTKTKQDQPGQQVHDQTNSTQY